MAVGVVVGGSGYEERGDAQSRFVPRVSLVLFHFRGMRERSASHGDTGVGYPRG